MKATIETSLNETCDIPVHDSAGIIFDRLYSSVRRIKQSLQYTFSLDKSESSLLVAFLRQQQRKARLVDQAIKDEFFFRRNIRRKNIPQRTWNRHSAFLYYSQQTNKQKLQQHTAEEQLADRTFEKSVEHVGRMSFQVKSIRLLPVWASACHEMSPIECDLSSLRLMEFQRIELPAAKAA